MLSYPRRGLHVQYRPTRNKGNWLTRKSCGRKRQVMSIWVWCEVSLLHGYMNDRATNSCVTRPTTRKTKYLPESVDYDLFYQVSCCLDIFYNHVSIASSNKVSINRDNMLLLCTDSLAWMPRTMTMLLVFLLCGVIAYKVGLYSCFSSIPRKYYFGLKVFLNLIR